MNMYVSVVDWRKEPRRSRSGISWLVEGPKITVPDGKCYYLTLCMLGNFSCCHVVCGIFSKLAIS